MILCLQSFHLEFILEVPIKNCLSPTATYFILALGAMGLISVTSFLISRLNYSKIEYRFFLST